MARKKIKEEERKKLREDRRQRERRRKNVDEAASAVASNHSDASGGNELFNNLIMMHSIFLMGCGMMKWVQYNKERDKTFPVVLKGTLLEGDNDRVKQSR